MGVYEVGILCRSLDGRNGHHGIVKIRNAHFYESITTFT
jgi:hypothetical protein